MLPLPLVAFGLATIGAYAKPTIRTVGGLQVSLSTPTDKVASASELRVVATVKNVGDEDLKVLKFETVLDDKPPARSFIISKNGEEVPFTGVKVSISADQLSDNDWVIIPAGKTMTTEHNVSSVYDFSVIGPGTFTFDPVSMFQVIGPDGTVKTNIADAGSVSITVTDDVSGSKFGLGRHPKVRCADPKKASFLSDSIAESKLMASVASAYIRKHGVRDSVYRDHFGSNPPSLVMYNFDDIRSESLASGYLDCADPLNLCGNIVSYTDASGDIYFCPEFFDYLPPSSLCHGNDANNLNLRGGSVTDEFAFAALGTGDLRNNCPESRKLFDFEKIRNGANYRCFAAQVYKNTRCSSG